MISDSASNQEKADVFKMQRIESVKVNSLGYIFSLMQITITIL